MIRAAALLLLLASLAPPLRGQEPLPADAFQSPEARDNLRARAGAFDGRTAADLPFEPESLAYRMRAFGMSGGATQTLEPVSLAGRQAYRIRQAGSVAGRRQAEESFVDAAGLFPIRYRRERSLSAREIRADGKDWDLLGLRLFAEGALLRDGRPQRTLYRRETRLGAGLPGSALDPLAAILLYRHAARLATNALPELAWTVLEGNDGVFRVTFRPLGTPAAGQHPALGPCRLASVELAIRAEAPEPDADAGRLRLDLALDKQAIPVKYDGVWRGIPFELVLTNATLQALP